MGCCPYRPSAVILSYLGTGMSGSSNGNGNEDEHRTPLEAVTQRIAEHQEQDFLEDDPLDAWKRVGGAVTLAQLHAGLLAVSQIAEAAIEGGVKMSGDLKYVLPAIQEVSGHLNEITNELSAMTLLLNAARKDIQALKDNQTEILGQVQQLPAIKSLLVEALTR
jgi:hypothetical protein